MCVAKQAATDGEARYQLSIVDLQPPALELHHKRQYVLLILLRSHQAAVTLGQKGPTTHSLHHISRSWRNIAAYRANCRPTASTRSQGIFPCRKYMEEYLARVSEQVNFLFLQPTLKRRQGLFVALSVFFFKIATRRDESLILPRRGPLESASLTVSNAKDNSLSISSLSTTWVLFPCLRALGSPHNVQDRKFPSYQHCRRRGSAGMMIVLVEFSPNRQPARPSKV